jgi:hypothetical protein
MSVKSSFKAEHSLGACLFPTGSGAPQQCRECGPGGVEEWPRSPRTRGDGPGGAAGRAAVHTALGVSCAVRARNDGQRHATLFHSGQCARADRCGSAPAIASTEKREAEAARIREKYPDRVPVRGEMGGEGSRGPRRRQGPSQGLRCTKAPAAGVWQRITDGARQARNSASPTAAAGPRQPCGGPVRSPGQCCTACPLISDLWCLVPATQVIVEKAEKSDIPDIDKKK